MLLTKDVHIGRRAAQRRPVWAAGRALACVTAHACTRTLTKLSTLAHGSVHAPMRAPMHALTLTLTLAMTLALTLALALRAWALDSGSNAQGWPYVSGGVGDEELQQLHAQRHNFNLWLVTAAKGSGAHLADVLLSTLHANRLRQAFFYFKLDSEVSPEAQRPFAGNPYGDGRR